MDARSYLLLGLLVLPSACDVHADGGVEPEPRRPNVLVLLSDDQAAATMGFEGHPWSRTPALDSLAAEGAVFTNAFVTTSLCAPSRASLLTGRYARSHGVLDNQRALPLGLPTFATRMAEAGYDCAYVGKWHLGGTPAPETGFGFAATFERQGSYTQNTFVVRTGADRVERHIGGWVDDVSTSFALEFIRRKRQAPFLLVVGFKSCHSPYRPARRNALLYLDADVEPPANALPYPPFPMRHERVELAHAAGVPVEAYVTPEDWLAAGASRRPEDWTGSKVRFDERLRDYFRVLYGLDQDVGKLLAALRELGVEDDTVVVYTSDNGMSLGSHGLLGKHTAYEESVRVPLLVRYPRRVPAGLAVDGLVLNVDVAPTLLELAGLEPVPGMQGQSLVPLLGTSPTPWRDAVLLENYVDEGLQLPTSFALRTREWKLIEYPGYETWTGLFHLASDPGETRNLARDPAFAGQLAALRARLARAEAGIGPRPGRTTTRLPASPSR
jgi:arylsulfatase A-like enzyme